MGCWGLGLFQSDHDYDVVSELSGEAGVDRLYTPDDPAALRDVLEKDGKLSKMFDKWETRGDGYGIGTTPKYSTVILGACAMEVGAKIEERHLSLLRNIYSSCGLYEEGERQMKKALAGYKNDGTPWAFQSLGLYDTMEVDKENVSRFCATCDKQHTEENTLKACSKCKNVFYCNRDCQKADWKFHKRHCGKPQSQGTSCGPHMLNADMWNAMRGYA